jgi:hypothetical protein
MASMTGPPPPPCSTIPASEVGKPVRLRMGAHVGVDEHVIVVQVRDRASAVRVKPERERADHERLEVST